MVHLKSIEKDVEIVNRHDNGAEWGRVLLSLSPYHTLIYLLVTLPIPSRDEKSNFIFVHEGFGYSP